jgi:hypothetical protein
MILPENAIPAGSMPPQEAIFPGQAQTPEQGAAQTGTETQTTNQDGLPILGKFKSPEELAKAYAELEKDHGRIGSELGNTRKQNELLMNHLNAQLQNQGQAGNAGAQPQLTDFDTEIANTTQMVEAGDLSVGEGMKKVAELTAAKVASMSQQQFAEYDKKRSAETVLQQFRRDNPEFDQVLASGALEPFKQANPMHDNLSAFYEWKGQQAITAAEQKVKEAYEKGKAETAALAAGADGTRKVLTKPGGEARTTNQQTGPVTEADKIQGMLAALQQARGG